MLKVVRQILATLITGSLASCSEPSLLTEKEKLDMIFSIRQTLDNYYNDIRKEGLTAELKYLDNTAKFFWVPPGYARHISYDSVVTNLKQNALHYKNIDNRFDTLWIIPLTRELATYTGKIHSTLTDTNNKKMTFSLVETRLLIKRPDGWKLFNGQTAIVDQ